ncbi:hypothetical protein [uncultured Dokdonia sp.]|uniref:hypothetical protein n=1 Tax=uncultured Dokdonia sp. TaxID=575653 RepID=UPI002627AA33|nr:hypothetical protein [uncultured Dokdonia sp.]
MSRISLFLSFIFLISFSPLYSQIDGDSGNGTSGYQAPDITPVNPQTASLGRYGNVPINTATGKMGFSVPIYNIAVDGGSMPVSLEYSYGGLILEAAPSLWGLGWNLNAYGSITKEVRGLPDGHPDGYYGANNVKGTILEPFMANWNDPNNATLGPMEIYDFIEILYNKYDSEVDKYTVNVGGMQFSFKLRYEGNTVVPYYLSQHNYKVDVTMSTTEYFAVGSFVVTSDQGVKYYFDNDNTESVYTEPVGLTKYTEDKNTSWVLSRVLYPNGEDIEYTYEEEQYDLWGYAAWGTTLISGFEGTPSGDPNSFVAGYGDRISKTVMRRMNLSRIDFPEGSLDFGTATTADGRLLYNSITLKNIENTVVDQYDISYLGVREGLVNIQKNNEFLYGFEYHGIHTPEDMPVYFLNENDLPLDQDSWKYFNDANNDYAVNLEQGGYIADKSPDFSSTRLGAMRRILYPTGGYSTIEYEQNQIADDYNESVGNGPVAFNRQLLVQLNPSVDNDEREVTFQYTFNEPTEAYISHKLEGDALNNFLEAKITKIGGGPCNEYNCYSGGYDTSGYYYEQAPSMREVLSVNCSFYPLPVLCPTLITSIELDNTPSGYGYKEENSAGRVVIAPGTYEFTITTKPNNGNSPPLFSTGSMHGEIRIGFYEPPTDQNNEVPESANVNIGGIRVTRINHYTDGALATKTIYDYNDDEGLSTGRINHIPQEIFTQHLTRLNHPSGNEYQEVRIHDIKAFSYLNDANGVPVYYGKVRTYSEEGEVFQPVSGEEALSVSTIPLDTNPNGSRIITVSGPNPNAVVNVDGVIGRYTDVYPEGYTTQEFTFPQEYPYFRYPGVPTQEDLTKAVPKGGETFVYNPNTVDYDTVRSNETLHGILKKPSSNHEYFDNGETYSYDTNTDHPWSFKIVIKPHRILDYSLYDYDEPYPSDPAEAQALKDLHDVHPYRETVLSRRPTQTTTYTQGITSIQSIEYDSYTQVKKQTTTTSEGEVTSQELFYPYSTEVASEEQYQDMVANNVITTPVMTKATQDGTLLATQKTNFTQVENGFKPSSIESAKATDALEERIRFEGYSEIGNIQEVRNTAGEYTSFIWGYDGKYVVAKVANARYLNATNGLDFEIINSPASDAVLQSELDEIRQNNPNAQVTTYTYKPLVGVTSVTDPRGYTMFYEYDTQNRLKYVKDQDGKVYSKNEYHYSTSN